VRFADVDWFEAEDNYVRVHTAGRRYLVRQTMRALEDQLKGKDFARIHRGAIVNMARVRELRALFHGEYEVVLSDGTRLTLSRTFRDSVLGRRPAG
jgi:two-component system, LytTR family, response regulator